MRSNVYIKLSMIEIDALISSFVDTNLKLKIAIENDNDQAIIRNSEIVDDLLEQMVSIPFDDTESATRLYKFLFKEFVVKDETGYETRKRICENVFGKF